tara:strand:- start:903 stop:1382 length:480 start_codon:yes stop_codon:yes gene_type:complete
MKIIKNFLPQNKFIKVKELITGDYFPWFYKDNTEIKGGYFCHSFFYNNQINSTLNYECTQDIYKILKPTALIEARANLFFSLLFNNKKAQWHTDYNYNNWTSILYLNTTDGGTEFKINNKIKPIKAEENKMIIFKCNTLHRPILTSSFEKRYIINFNYF